MKKLLILLVTMCTALCASAEDLKFGVEVNGNTVTVTPSNNNQEYFCSIVGSQEINAFAQIAGMEINTPERYFYVASSDFHPNNLHTGVVTIENLADDNYVLVACVVDSVKKVDHRTGEEYMDLAPVGEITIEKITISVNGGSGEITTVDMTFTFECTNEGYTVTPSDDSEEYVAIVHTPEDLRQFGILEEYIEQYESAVFTLGNMLKLMASMGAFVGHTCKGISSETQADGGSLLTETGRYLVAVVGVRPYGKGHIFTTPVYYYDWNITSLTDICKLEIKAQQPKKMFKGGKIIINDRFNLNGTLVK